jgi:hypothetical protein
MTMLSTLRLFVSVAALQLLLPPFTQIVPNFRVRTIPVLGTAPAIFGMAAASFILCQLAGSPFDGEPIIQLTAQQYDRALIRLQQREEEVFGNSKDLPVDRDDVSGFSAIALRCWYFVCHITVTAVNMWDDDAVRARGAQSNKE